MNSLAFSSAGALLALLVAGAIPANAAGCQLGSNGSAVKHIVYLQFDNVHLRRDNPNVPSDLEQIPTLLHFLEDQGTLLTNHHTPLIYKTAGDIEPENIPTDVDTVFGAGSPEDVEADTPATKTLAAADFEGIAIHCAQGSPLCGGSAHGQSGVLNDEPPA